MFKERIALDWPTRVNSIEKKAFSLCLSTGTEQIPWQQGRPSPKPTMAGPQRTASMTKLREKAAGV
jgi:hypothetical protein